MDGLAPSLPPHHDDDNKLPRFVDVDWMHGLISSAYQNLARQHDISKSQIVPFQLHDEQIDIWTRDERRDPSNIEQTPSESKDALDSLIEEPSSPVMVRDTETPISDANEVPFPDTEIDLDLYEEITSSEDEDDYEPPLIRSQPRDDVTITRIQYPADPFEELMDFESIFNSPPQPQRIARDDVISMATTIQSAPQKRTAQTDMIPSDEPEAKKHIYEACANTPPVTNPEPPKQPANMIKKDLPATYTAPYTEPAFIMADKESFPTQPGPYTEPACPPWYNPQRERRSSRRRRLSIFSERQQEELDRMFVENPFCPRGRKQVLGAMVGVHPDDVLYYFEKKRSALRKRLRRETSALVPYQSRDHVAQLLYRDPARVLASYDPRFPGQFTYTDRYGQTRSASFRDNILDSTGHFQPILPARPNLQPMEPLVIPPYTPQYSMPPTPPEQETRSFSANHGAPLHRVGHDVPVRRVAVGICAPLRRDNVPSGALESFPFEKREQSPYVPLLMRAPPYQAPPNAHASYAYPGIAHGALWNNNQSGEFSDTIL